jgi:hypothetical protein
MPKGLHRDECRLWKSGHKMDDAGDLSCGRL